MWYYTIQSFSLSKKPRENKGPGTEKHIVIRTKGVAQMEKFIEKFFGILAGLAYAVLVLVGFGFFLQLLSTWFYLTFDDLIVVFVSWCIPIYFFLDADSNKGGNVR